MEDKISNGYQLPSMDLLDDYTKYVLDSELEINPSTNKESVIQILDKYKIKYTQIEEFIGKTMSVYEVTLEEGYRISKIRLIIDDIFLSLGILGLRLVFPPNSSNMFHIEIPHVSVLPLSFKEAVEIINFQDSDMTLPFVVGRDVKDNIIVKDLVKLPHLLIAGRFGSGKGVAINDIITSLILKKTPEELKFVLIDIDEETFSVYNHLNKDFFAVLPEDKDKDKHLVISDTVKAVQTLHALCEEMNKRYDKLKNSKCRCISEYNEKHERMPYIIVAIYEYAELMLSAGKEFELPLCRLAQIARAVGIHVIISTEMFRYNVITGSIKANFPTKWCFRTSASMDSRLILDRADAVTLNKAGDSIFAKGSSMLRVQSPHIMENEIEKVIDYINNNTEGVEPYVLPKFKIDKSENVVKDDESLLIRKFWEGYLGKK